MFHVTMFSLVEPEFLLVGILALCVLGTVDLSMVPDLHRTFDSLELSAGKYPVSSLPCWAWVDGRSCL